MAKHPLSDEQVEQYRVEGFVVAESVFDADELAEVDRVIRELTQQALASDDHSALMEIEPVPARAESIIVSS